MKVVKLVTFLALTVSICFGYGTSTMLGQADTGSISGTITDTSGASIANATVTAVDALSGTSYTATSSAAGFYTLASVRPGSYTISATAAGFSKATATGLTVSISTRVPEDLKLPVGSASETVQVNANALQLETETSDIGTVISSREVEDLPLSAGGGIRSFSTLAFLSPGAVGPGTNGGTTFTKIGGGQTEGSDFLIDGVSTFRSENGTADFDQTTPSVDAIQEFRVETLSLPAYLGRSTGGLANFKTRSGTNEYHGMVYDFFKNAALDANNWFNNGNAVSNPATASLYAVPKDNKNDFGVTLGGPVAIPHLYNGRDKTFFFFDWEQYRFGSSGVSVQTVPTLAERSGDFSSTLGAPVASKNNLDPCTGQVVLDGQIFDPNTTQVVNGEYCRTPFANNQVPLNRSAIAQKVLALIPVPNFVGVGTQNYSQRYSDQTDQTVYSLRLDQNFGSRQHLFFFGSSRENTDDGSLTLPNPLNSGANVTDQYYKYLRVGWDYTVSPTMVNSLTVGGNRVNSFNVASAVQANTNYDAELGIPNTLDPGTTFPVFNIGEGLPSIGSPNFDDNVDNAYIINNDLTIDRGRHSIRVGGTLRYQQFTYDNSGPAAGTFDFGRAQTAGTNDPVVDSASGNGIASFLLGSTASATRAVQLHVPQWRSNYYAAYMQDDWKPFRTLTINAGLRYSIDTPRHEADGDTSSLNPTLPNNAANGIPGALEFGGVGAGRDGSRTQQWANNYYKDFGPRIGFSYAPDIYQGKVVFRGAYGIIYGPIVYSDFGQGLTQGFTASPGITANANGFLPFGPLDSGPNAISMSPDVDPTQLNGSSSIDYVPKTDGRPAEVQNFSFETQTELAPDLIFTIGFLGERGTHLKALLIYPNDDPLGALALGNVLLDAANSPQAAAAGVKVPYANFFTTWPGGTTEQALRPFPQYSYINTDSYLQNTGQSTYDALEVKLERRFHDGLTLLSSYTWSKTMTDADSIQPFFSTVLGQGGTQNPYDLKAEKAVSTQDVPNNFVVSYLYDLPAGHGRKYLSSAPKIVDEAVGGWRIGGIQRYLSGQPISFFGAGGIPGFDNGIRYDQVGTIIQIPNYGHSDPFTYAGPTSAGSVFNKAAFLDPNANRGAGPFQFGTMPRNSANARTPVYLDEDFNVSKTFPIREQINAEFRVEAFDAFNRHVFSKPDSGVQDLNFGQITGLNNGPRNLQVVLKIHY